MTDMSGRVGDSLAEKAQLGGETQKGHSTAQTRDRLCVKRLDLLNPELQASGALEEISVCFQTRISEGGL